MSVESVFCTQCGARNPVAARFCDQCGAQLVKPQAATGAQPVQAAPPPPAQSFMCSVCGVSALPGEAFCDSCGAPLALPGMAVAPPPQPVYPPPQPVGAAPVTPARSPVAAPPVAAPPVATPPPPPATRAMLAPAWLQVEGTSTSIPLPTRAEVIIGRSDPASNFYPEIDLTPYGALEHGVGRRHLRLAIHENQIVAEDLDSTNGSAINGRRLTPRQPEPLAPGDLLIIGRLGLRLQE